MISQFPTFGNSNSMKLLVPFGTFYGRVALPE
jgi:hypothetical protein